jgi:hypothetical protein
LRLTLVVAIVVVALAGCGGDDEDTAGPNTTSISTRAPTTTSATNGSPDAPAAESPATGEAVRASAEAVLTSSDPGKACGKYVTDHYLSVAYGGRRGCVQAQAPAGAADQLEFKSVRVDGERARAVVVPSGGPYDGERVTVSVVRDGPRWAIDELDADLPVGP